MTRAPDGPAVMMEGARVAPGAGGPVGEALPRVSVEIQVTYDYLRLGMGFLELPLPDGLTIEAENAVFEDRGGGNLMWSGEVPGAGYESVLFTVQDGHLVGWFGEPGGPKYVVYAGPDGRGSLSEEVGPVGDWCGVEAGPARHLVQDAAATLDRPSSVASESSGDRIDILVLYPEGTERYWRVIGGPAVGVRQLGDYLSMVFRNGALPATANLTAVRWDPELRNHPSTQGGHFVTRSPYYGWHYEFVSSRDVRRLVARHAPDLVHFVPVVGVSGFAGRATIRTGLYGSVYTGWSVPVPHVFAHEIGHNLGGGHDPPASFPGPSDYLRPYAFGHTDLTSCSKREGYGDQLLCPATIMSLGSEARTDDNSKTISFGEPFYSSVRHKPNGWTIGVAGERENERVFQETIPVVVRVNGGGMRNDGRGAVVAEWADVDTVRVTWGDAGSFAGSVHFSGATEGWNDAYVEGAWLTPLKEEDKNGERVLGVDVRGLRPGGGYRVAIGHKRRSIGASGGGPVLELEPPRMSAGAPAAPSNVGTRVTGPDSVRLHWRDNSTNESGFKIWHRKWSGGEPDEIWSRYGGSLPAGTRHMEIEELAAEEITYSGAGSAMRGRYSFVVVAYNDRGWNASETYHLEFMPGPHPEVTASGKRTNCYRRSTGIDLDGYRVSACLETPDGARRRMWDYQLEADQSGLLYFFERDNAEILVKVLDGCGVNGHRWVFVAPVTDLAFRLSITEPGPYISGRSKSWRYDSKRRAQEQISGFAGNPKGRTARTVSDTTAFPCTTAEVAAAKARLAEADGDAGNLAPGGGPPTVSTAAASATRLAAGAATDCIPSGPALTLSGGHTVSMCYETAQGSVGAAKDWGLDSTQSGLLYFFDRNNAEVLIKVLDACGVNGHRWVFVAPVTDLAFNLVVESPSGERWTHTNRLGQTADAASDVTAFPCTSSA